MNSPCGKENAGDDGFLSESGMVDNPEEQEKLETPEDAGEELQNWNPILVQEQMLLSANKIDKLKAQQEGQKHALDAARRGSDAADISSLTEELGKTSSELEREEGILNELGKLLEQSKRQTFSNSSDDGLKRGSLRYGFYSKNK